MPPATHSDIPGVLERASDGERDAAETLTPRRHPVSRTTTTIADEQTAAPQTTIPVVWLLWRNNAGGLRWHVCGQRANGSTQSLCTYVTLPARAKDSHLVERVRDVSRLRPTDSDSPLCKLCWAQAVEEMQAAERDGRLPVFQPQRSPVRRVPRPDEGASRLIL
jgi:hypothetical protein